MTAQFRGLSTQSGYAVMNKSHSWHYTGYTTFKDRRIRPRGGGVNRYSTPKNLLEKQRLTATAKHMHFREFTADLEPLVSRLPPS